MRGCSATGVGVGLVVGTGDAVGCGISVVVSGTSLETQPANKSSMSVPLSARDNPILVIGDTLSLSARGNRLCVPFYLRPKGTGVCSRFVPGLFQVLPEVRPYLAG